MDRNYVMRCTLWTTAALNLGAAMIVLFPSFPFGQLAGLPASVPFLYRSLLAYLVALFAFAYAWLARQPCIDRPLVVVAAIGKAGTVVVALACWLGGQTSGRSVLFLSGDLVFAAIFAWWLLAERSEGQSSAQPAARS